MADGTQMLNLGGSIPPEILQQQQALNRQQQMAQLLMQQGMNQPQGQMVSGRYVAPSFFQYAAPLAQMYVGQKISKESETEARKIAETLRKQQREKGEQFFEAMQGKPAVYGEDIPTETYETVKGSMISPATGPDYRKAFSIATDPDAPNWLKAQATEMLKPQRTKAGETVSQLNLTTGKYEPIVTGGMDLPESLKYAIAIGQLPSDPTKWTQQQAQLAQKIVESKAGAGASKFDFSNLLGKSGIAPIGDMLKESKIAATGAIQTADAANRIISAVDSGKIIAGPSANVRLGVAQVSQLLGAGGNTQAEMIANSRQAIQGLAQLTLQGRKQMRGEGAITESESRLAERAMSGDINFTAAEIKQLAESARRSAKFTYQQHEGMINTLQADPQNKGLVPYYQVQANPSIFESQSAKARSPSAIQQQADKIIGK